MVKKSEFVQIYQGAFITICLAWMGLFFFHFRDFLSGAFFLCILGAGIFLRFLERDLHQEKVAATERRVKRLESKAWYFESIMTNSRDILFTTDQESRIIKFNKGSEKVFGVMALEVLGQPVRNLFEDPEEIDQLLNQLEETGRAEAVEFRVRNRKTDSDVWISVGVSKLSNWEEASTALLDQNRPFVGVIFSCQDVTHRRDLELELKDKNVQLTRLSITDSLTSLYNVRQFKNEANRQLYKHNRYPDRPLALALIDVDKFKDYNDKFGHLAGDNLLIILSEIIQIQIRKNLDTAYRYGGDEFVLMLPETGTEGAKSICERILVDFMGHNLGETSLSIGIAQYRQDWGPLSASLIISKADEAMYMVKCRGGNGLHVYSEPLSDDLKSRKVLEPFKNIR